VNVNSVLISLIVAGDPGAGLAKGVETNDKDYLPRFPFLAPAHQGSVAGPRRHQRPRRADDSRPERSVVSRLPET
jgi:hypothetical protein